MLNINKNNLADDPSPYLQQHKNNPVNWQIWSSETLNFAKSNSKPILLSIGYASCHWCHVMAHESFEDNETAELLENHLAIILDHPDNLKNKKESVVKIAYPVKNFDLEQDGITQLICTLMGGQMDIEEISHCRLLDVELPDVFLKNFKGPKVGMDEIKKRTSSLNRPLLGGIVKPKTGLDINELKEVCIKMVKGGADFIKEDEILGNPSCCPFEERVKIVNDAIQNEATKMNKEVFYAPCVNSDLPYLLNRIEFLVKNILGQ